MNLVSARSRKQFLTDKFEYSQYLFALQCKDIVRKSFMLITSVNWRVNSPVRVSRISETETAFLTEVVDDITSQKMEV